MTLSQSLVYLLIFLPAIIALLRRCNYRLIILLVCTGLAMSNYLDVHETLANRNAHHSMVLFFIEILSWLPVFILSVYAQSKGSRQTSG